jgi:hypothetical protein
MQQIWKVVDDTLLLDLGLSRLDRGQTQLPPLHKATHSTPSLPLLLEHCQEKTKQSKTVF